MKFSINVLYRCKKNYNNIDEIISIIEYDNDCEVNIYNFFNDTIISTYDTVDFNKSINVSTLIKNIYNESDDDTYIIILDSSINYNNINLNTLKTQTDLIQFLRINNYIIPYTIGSVDYNNNIIKQNYMVTYSNTSLVITASDNYLDNYYEPEVYSIQKMIYEFLYNRLTTENIEIYLDYFQENNLDHNKIERFYLNLIKIKMKYKNYIEILLHSLTTYNNCLLLYSILYELIINNKLNECSSEYYKNILSIFYTATDLDNFSLNNYKLFNQHIIDDDSMLISCVIFLRNKVSKFIINDIYNIKIIKNLDNTHLNEYYPNITENVVELNTKNFKLDSNLLFDLDNLWYYDSKKISITNRNAGIINYNKLLVYNHDNNLLRFYTASNNELISLNTHTCTNTTITINIMSYEILGNFIYFNGYYITGLVKDHNDSKILKFLILDSDLKFHAFSKNITVNVSEKISGIYNINGDLGLFYIKNKKICKLSLNCVNLMTQFLTSINIDSNINLVINRQINVNFKIDNYLLKADSYIYKNYNFIVNNLDKSHNTLEYNGTFFMYNNVIFSYSNFIYFPVDYIINNTKNYDLCFHNNCVDGEFYVKCQEFDIGICDNYSYAKYYVIQQCDLEKMSSCELSLIINNNCLIISLINEEDARDINTFNYSSDENLSKLFLFNIVKNSTYIEFLFDKVIHGNQYDARLEFMEKDKKQLLHNCSVFKICRNFLKNPDDMINIELLDSNKQIFKNIKSNLINKVKQSHYKQLTEVLKQIIFFNYNANIFLLGLDDFIVCPALKSNEVGNIINIIKKVNFTGCIYYNRNEFCKCKNSIIISNTLADIENITISKNTLIYIITNNNLFFY